MATTVIENLITRFGFEVDQQALDKINDGIKSAVKGLTAIVAAAAAAGTAMFIFAKKTAESNDTLGKFAEVIGIDLEALQELGFVAEANGGSIDSMNSSLSNLSKVMAEASKGMGGGVEAFGRLGLSVTDAEGRIKSADDFLFELADSFAELETQAERIELAGKLGIDQNLILSLQEGSEALRRQREEARELGFIIGKDAAKAAANFNGELQKVTSVISGLSNKIGQELMKEITPLLTAFVEWFKINKQIIGQNIAKFLFGVIRTFRVLVSIGLRVIDVIKWIVDSIGGLKIALGVLGGIILALNFKALLLPIVLGGIALALVLLLDEIRVFSQGGESVLGKALDSFIERFKALGRVIQKTKNFLKGKGFVLTTEEKGVFGAETRPEEQVREDEIQRRLREAQQDPTVRRNEQGVILLPPIGGAQTSMTVNNDIKIEIGNGDAEDVGRKVRDGVNDAMNDLMLTADQTLSSNVRN